MKLDKRARRRPSATLRLRAAALARRRRSGRSISVNPLESIFILLDRDLWWRGRFEGQRRVACRMLTHVAGKRLIMDFRKLAHRE
ncbi:hypothetical protein EVAR_4781_1 [Eumeta japonica]|uniref:Uncharacterized protein n=1 Tax=Eumeta variegata TaxID=151549 RepID=A0A4C1T2A8_EUMVA|nr:hypothetical protein EVAR_4781_1 [Eumeta japonica]